MIAELLTEMPRKLVPASSALHLSSKGKLAILRADKQITAAKLDGGITSIWATQELGWTGLDVCLLRCS